MEATESAQEQVLRLDNATTELPAIANPAPPPEVKGFEMYHCRGPTLSQAAKGAGTPPMRKLPNIGAQTHTGSSPLS
jgi:hypothetical protein